MRQQGDAAQHIVSSMKGISMKLTQLSAITSICAMAITGAAVGSAQAATAQPPRAASQVRPAERPPACEGGLFHFSRSGTNLHIFAYSYDIAHHFTGYGLVYAGWGSTVKGGYNASSYGGSSFTVTTGGRVNIDVSLTNDTNTYTYCSSYYMNE